MVLNEYLAQHNHRLEDVIEKTDYTIQQVAEWHVMQYPDELLYVLSKELKETFSILFYDLLRLENPGGLRRVASDYGLLQAIANDATYVFIPRSYRKEQTKLLTDLLIEKEVFELELGPIAKYNFIGKKIYEVFLSSVGTGAEFQRIEDQLADYFVLVHDDEGTLLCHSSFAVK